MLVGMPSPGAFLTARLHIDLQRVLSAVCPA
ncbi:putative leader peptide [Fodinicola acaciae]